MSRCGAKFSSARKNADELERNVSIEKKRHRTHISRNSLPQFRNFLQVINLACPKIEKKKAVASRQSKEKITCVGASLIQFNLCHFWSFSPHLMP